MLMNKMIFNLALFLGVVAVACMGWIFAGTDTLAFTVTCIIAMVYGIGVVELWQFRKGTDSLTGALGRIPNNMANLSEWLYRIDPALQNAVRMRVEDGRAALPAPVLTPYLVGLLVMLGLLGTFLGLVGTLKGAVIALEGTTDLQAIRAGLVAPIKGLEVAFGTSVAGVAASAMLGLMSAMSRRDRLLCARVLDTKTANEFRAFSGAHQRQLSYKALQTQAQALPVLTQSLETMGARMERLIESLSERLITGQAQFHDAAKNNYETLATSVDQTLRDAITQSGQRAGESIEPIVTQVMGAISAETQNTHQQLAATLQKQFDVLARGFTDTSQGIANTWKRGITEQARAGEGLMQHMGDSHNMLMTQFQKISTTLIDTFDSMGADMLAQQAQGDQARLKQWDVATEQAQQRANAVLAQASEALTLDLTARSQAQGTLLDTVIADFKNMVAQLSNQLADASETSLAHQRATVQSLETVANTLANQATHATEKVLLNVQQLLQETEALVHARVDTESNWLSGHDARMADLSETVKVQLELLRAAEAQRGEDAVARLADLEAAVVTHLSTLGQALEAPMTQLIETASETPRAAAEVIAQLRAEISKNIERDNTHLQAQGQMMETLSQVSKSLVTSTEDQRQAIDRLVQGTTETLLTVETQFTEKLNTEAEKISEASGQVVGSALEISSLGEGFGAAVALFDAANEKLMTHLNQLEQTLQQSTDRSDEQLGYYVAQAREIIDYSVASQQDLVEAVRKIHHRQLPEAVEVV